MKSFRELLENTNYTTLIGNEQVEISSLTYDSRKVTAGSCFFAVPGVQCDGHNFIAAAIKAGAAAVVCERIPDGVDTSNCAVAMVEDTNAAMAQCASSFYGHPSRQLKVVGVTGTNGKTTIATLLYDLVRAMGHKAGLISTVVYKIDEREVESTHTTPDAIRLQQMMAEMVKCGCEYCFMECSSHAIVQHRIGGIEFTGALFTNLTHDHLDYHKTFAEYIRAKKQLFDRLPKRAFALVNVDDRNGEVMLQNTSAKRYTLSLRRMADFKCRIIEMLTGAMLLKVDNRDVWVRLVGRFNAYNMLTVYGAALLLGFDREEVLQQLSLLHSVSGRFEMVAAKDGTTAIIDYAHTPDALENVISTINEVRNGNHRLIVMCGCGGNRDRSKRPEMASIAVREADLAIFTSDNPRHENAEDILRDMEEGVTAGSRYLKISDRGEAIKTAVMLAEPGDIILLAGKGHECYQIIGDEQLPFSDKEEVTKWFENFKR